MAGGATIPGHRLGEITLDTKTGLIEVSDLLFGAGKILVGRFAVPGEGLLVVTMDAAAVLVHRRQIVLRGCIALVRGQTVVAYGVLVVLRQPGVVVIHAAELILCWSIALGCRFSVPCEDLRVIQCLEADAKVVIAEGELCLGVSGSCGRENIRSRPLRTQQRGNKAEE